MVTLAFPPRGQASAYDYLKFFADAVVPYEIFEAFTDKEVKTDLPETSQESSENSDLGFEDDDLWAELEAVDKSTQVVKEHRFYSNYVDLFTEHLFLQWIYNSLIIAFSASFIGVLLAATAAYSFARFEFPGKQIAIGFLFTTQMIPAPMMIIPVYLVIRSIGLGNTYAGLVLAMSVTTLPFSIMVLRGYFATVPKALKKLPGSMAVPR